jgi:hypothetical protein
MASHLPDTIFINGLQFVLPVVLLLFAYLVLGRLREYWRLRFFKGPTTTGISWWWHSRAVIGGKAYEYYGDVTEKYGMCQLRVQLAMRKSTHACNSGPIARIAPNHLITSDADFWSRINAVRSPYRRSPWYYHAARFEPGKDNVFTECDNDRHDLRRKKMASGVSDSDGSISINILCTLDSTRRKIP